MALTSRQCIIDDSFVSIYKYAFVQLHQICYYTFCANVLHKTCTWDLKDENCSIILPGGYLMCWIRYRHHNQAARNCISTAQRIELSQQVLWNRLQRSNEEQDVRLELAILCPPLMQIILGMTQNFILLSLVSFWPIACLLLVAESPVSSIL